MSLYNCQIIISSDLLGLNDSLKYLRNVIFPIWQMFYVLYGSWIKTQNFTSVGLSIKFYLSKNIKSVKTLISLVTILWPNCIEII